MSKNWLQTKELCRYYRRGPQEVKAVDHVSIDINRGDFIALVGASGSGKSTMLNLMAGLDSPTSGEVFLENRSLTSLTSRELALYRAEKVGMVFQAFNLIGHYDALRNVETALYFSNMPSSDREPTAIKMLTELGLKDRLDHKPADLSGGEQQRVALARALVKKPEILFADEPTGNLDYENTENIIKLLQKLNRDGLTIIMVTHDLELAHTVASRVIRMKYGVIDNDLS